MFINCRHCDALVATNPATDEPPERCPRCGGVLREAIAPAVDAVAATGDAGSGAVTAGTVGADAAVQEPEAGTLAATSGGDLHRARDPAVQQAPDEGAADASATDEGVPAEQAVDAAPDDAGGAQDEATPPPAIVDADTGEPGRGDAMAEADATGAVDSADTQAPAADAATSATAVAPPAPAKPAPSFVAMRQQAPVAATRLRWLAPTAIGALSLLLLLQILLADRARLSADARWRPLLSGLCNVLGCSLPPWREPTAFRLVARDVRAHPQQPGVLRATATFRNDARWAQAWPRVVLTLSDVEGRAIGRRDFTPSEYLGDAPTENSLSSGQSAMILLDVVEPAANVVAFSFEFH
jgi:hypothetical protein